MYRVLALCFALICFSSSWAETAPDPLELSTNWWDYFGKHKQTIPTHSKELLNILNREKNTLSIENLNKANTLIQKINTNLQAYQQALQLPIPKVTPPPPILENYTIKQVVDLHREIRREKIELKANLMQQGDETREISITENYLDSLWKRYLQAEKRSGRKFVLGLEIILYKTALEVARQNRNYLLKTYEVDTKYTNALREELTTALTKLQSNRQEESQLAEEVTQTEALWKQAQQNLEKKATESVVTVSGSLGKDEEASNQLIISWLRRASIEEALAHNKFTSAKISHKLSQLLNDPTELDPDKVDLFITESEQTLASFNAQKKQWLSRAEELLHQYSQIFSLDDTTAATLAPTIRQIIDITQGNILLLQQFDNETSDSAFVLTTLDGKLTNIIGGQRKWLADVLEFFKGFFQTLWEWTDKTLFTIGDNRFTPLSIVRFILIFVVALWISHWIKRALISLAKTRKGVKKSIIYRINRLFHYLILILAALIALSSIGFDLSNLLLVAGALGVGLGFGLQSIFNNFISGIIILFESQLKVGDFIELEAGGLRGEIKEIHVRNTLIATNDGTDVLVPNSQIISNRVINWTLREPQRRVHVPFSVAYDTDKDLMKKVVLEAAHKVPSTLFKKNVPEPRVYIDKFGNDSLECELVVWVDEKSSRRNRNTRSQYLWEIDTAFRKHGIKVPYPQRDLHIKEILDDTSMDDIASHFKPKK